METPAAATVAAISNEGVSSAVLTTMLDQRADLTSNNAAAPDGANTLISNQGRDAPYAGQGSQGNAPLGTYATVNGSYEYKSSNGSYYVGGQLPENPFVRSVSMRLNVTNANGAVTLGNSMKATDGVAANPDTAPEYTGSGYAAAAGTVVPFGQPLGQWNNGGNWVRLNLTHVSDNKVNLCWEYSLPDTKRLYCNRWEIPDGWQAGQELKHLGGYINEKEYTWE